MYSWRFVQATLSAGCEGTWWGTSFSMREILAELSIQQTSQSSSMSTSVQPSLRRAVDTATSNSPISCCDSCQWLRLLLCQELGCKQGYA